MAATPVDKKPRFRLRQLTPGILIAATGVGAGDLLTAGMAGSSAGVVILWAVLVGAVCKWALNEGLARWQMATGTTLLEGWMERLGGWVQWIFVPYLAIWAFVTGGALVAACGVAGAGIYDWGLPLGQAKVVWGIVHGLGGLVLVWVGGFRLFEKLMSVCIAAMFGAVMLTVVLMRPDWSAVLRGMVVPQMPEGSLPWVLGLLGGVGGSVTLMSYGYWIREKDRTGHEGVRACRLDLAVGYSMTALFGVAMVTIGSQLDLEKGNAVALELAGQLTETMGAFGRWTFLIGFWGLVFSSLLGVWQSIPYLFADYVALRRGCGADERAALDYTKTPAYRGFLVALALVPLVQLGRELQSVQLTYAVMAALFMPLLALTLLLMNNRRAWVRDGFRSGWLVNALLVGTMAFFCYAGAVKLMRLYAALTAPA